MLLKYLLFPAVLLASLGLAAPAQAITGAEVTCADVSFTCSPETFTVTDGDPDPDTVLSGGSTPTFEIDFMGGWIDIIYLGTSSLTFNAGTIELSGLFDPVTPLVDLNIYDLGTTNVSGFGPDNLDLTDGTLTVDLAGTAWSTGGIVGFDVAVPLPASLLLLGTAIAGLGFASRRARQQA
ncbi:MAG: VPLPA-CTERM sorting domain-containing protein [Pseudomonadota bacterium]